MVHFFDRRCPSEEKDTKRGQQLLPEGDLVALAVELREREYSQLPTATKALALHALCERALDAFNADIEAASHELLEGKEKESKDAKKHAAEGKLKAAELKRECSEAWRARRAEIPFPPSRLLLLSTRR